MTNFCCPLNTFFIRRKQSPPNIVSQINLKAFFPLPSSAALWARTINKEEVKRIKVLRLPATTLVFAASSLHPGHASSGT